ncbi:MAG: hypothetical protein K9K32_07655 [Halanaerobiales bacterium]|nr:hypothetical protein [Halanaerobiales bacterium]
MHKIVTDCYYKIQVTNAIKLYENVGGIIAGKENHGRIFKLTIVERIFVNENEYAMVSLDGRDFWNGIFNTKKELLEAFSGDIYYFHDNYEYGRWLEEELI